MNKLLFNKTRFLNLICSILFLILGMNTSWGQTQTLGSFPYMDGGFEGQTATLAGTAISGALSTAAWSVSSSTKSTTKLVILDASAARSGSKYAAHTTNDVTIRLQSPSTATESAAPAVSTQYTVQYYFKTTTDPATGLNRGGIYNDAVNGNSTITVSTIVGGWSSNVWTKAYSTITTASGRTTPYAATGYGAVRTAIASSNLYDDFVIYPGVYDATAPSAATAPTATIPSATTFNIGWTGSTDSDKTGYMVVRYTVNPSANPSAVPNVNGIYAVGNTITNGSTTGTVAYIGNATSFVDSVSSTSTQFYYRIFTVDKAFNYSAPSDLTTVVDNTPPGNPGAVTVSGATATTLGISWDAASSIDGGGYLVVRYTSSPNADNDPTQNSTYVVGNTYANGTDSLTGTVIYVGTGLITTDTGLTTDATYYYKVYTFDQAKNYSGESSGSGTTTAAIDDTPPNAPGTSTISNQTTTTMNVSWLAASGGVDGGGYMVVRYTGDPTPETGANPVQKATYVVGNTYATGTNPDGVTAPKTARVIYVGTDLTCISSGLTQSDNTYYKVYTFDASYNYSDASFTKGKTSYQFVTPKALAATVPAADGFTANWNLLDNSLTPTAGIYTVKTYSVASTESTFVGWTIPATVADTASLIADVTTVNNTTKALTLQGAGSINTSVSGNPGSAARGSSWYSTFLISGTEILTDDADPLLVAVYATPKATPDRYWQVEVNTVGYINPTISSHQYSTNTGPRDFKLQYSSTGTSGTFTDLVSTITVLSTWNTTAVANVALPASCQNNPNVVLRWVQTSFTNTAGVEMTTPSTGGTSRIDNILVKGFKLTSVNTTTSNSTTNTSIPVTGLASGTYYYDVVASKNSTTDVATGIVSTFIASPNSNLISVSVTTPQNVANYRSTASGPISSNSIWQYFDGTAWQTATAAPANANSVTIQAGHTITLDANFVFNTGKSLTISGTLDLAGFNVSGAGATVTSNSASKIILGNNVSLASGITTATVALNTATNFDFNSTTVAQHTGGLPGSTLSTSSANGSQNYTTTLTGNITVSNPLGVTMNQSIRLNTPGVLTVTSTGKFLFGDGNVASETIAAGTLNSGSFNLTGTGSFVGQSDCTLVITSSKGISGTTDGNIRTSSARTFGSGINFVFTKNDGFNPISIGTSFYNGDINPATGIKNMTIDCPYGVYFASTYIGTANTNASGFVTTLTYTGGNDITVNGTLNFVSGKLYTGDYVTVATNSVPAVVVNSVSYYPVVSLVITPGNTSALKLNVGSSGSITGASSETGWIVGNLKKATSSGNSPSFNFAIGDATSYFPLALTFSGNTSADGELAIKSYPIALSNLADSGIDNTKKVNRYWSLTNTNLAGFGTYEATFNYATTENDASTTASSYVVRRFDNGTWSPLTTSGTPTTTTTTAIGNTGFGNFAIGQSNVAPTASAQSFCGSATVADLVPSSGTSFKWYSTSSGGTALDASTALTSGTYYVSLSFSGISETSRTAVAVTVNANSNARVVNVSSIAALQLAVDNSNCGDIIILADGRYTDTTLNIDRSNITVKAATNGGVYFDGVNDININGNYVKFNGFQFTSGDIGGLYLIEVWGSHNTLSQLNFNGYNAKKFIVIQANSQYNTVEYSNIKKLSDTDATQVGCAVQIHTSYTTPGYHKIRYCSFQNFEGAGGDYGNEPIRIGLSTENVNKSRSIVEYCYFNNTGLGDSETVSIKSQENTIRFCTFTNQQNAMLVFRNGDNNVAYSNFFIDAGGIRVKEANNIYCYNNYFQNSGSTTGAFNADAVTYLYDTSTYPVVLNNINFVHNTFYNCANIDFGGIGATNNTWANNIFKKDSGSIFMNANNGTTFAGNMYQGALGITIPSGMANTNPNLTLNSDNYYGLSSGSTAIDASSSSYPAILHIPNIDDDASLLYDVSGQSRPSLATLKDVGCDEFTSGAITNHPLALTEVGPTYLGGPATAAPTALAQSFCNSGTVANLVATGTAIKWYSNEGSTSVLSSTTALETGNYYVTQTINNIESERTSVSVTVNVTSSPAVESQVFCSSANATVASLVASGDSLVWYSAATDGSVLASDTALVSGNYYVSQTQNSCESSRSEVAVTFTNSIATQPTDTNICTTLGSLASISVVTTPGTTPTYSWFVSTTLVPAWTAITAANAGTTALPIYTNYTTATLNIKKQLLLVAGNKYRVVVTGGYCGTVTSNEVTLTVNALATVKAITGAVATCSGDAKTLTLATGSLGTIQWQSSTTSATLGFNPVVGGVINTTSTNSSTYATPALTESIWYRVASTNGACPVVNSAAVALAVTQPAVISAITGGDNTVCSYIAATASVPTAVTNSTALSVSTSAGTILWQKSVNYVNTTNAPAVWAAAGSILPELTATNLIATTWYRAQVTNGACIKYSNVVKITVTPKAVAGTITTNTTSVCLGGDITFTLAGKVGTIQWQSLTSATNFASAVNVGNGGTTYTVTNASGTSLFIRAVVSSELCSTATTAVKTIVVNPTSNGGTAKGGGVVCSGSPGTLSVAGNVGTIQWQSSSDGITFVNVPVGLTTAGATYASGSATEIAAKYLVTNITADTWFRAKIKSGICSEAYSNVVQYTIGTEAVAGTIAASASTICAASGTTLTLSNSIGAITWKKSTNWTAATPTWTAVASSATTPITNNGTTLVTGNLAATTAYQATVTIGCNTFVYSNIQIVTVNPAAKGGVVAVSTIGTNICSGGSKIMKVTGNVGTIQWQRSTTSATEGFENVAGATTASFEFLNITAPTWFKVVASSGVCTVTNASNAVQITVTTTPAVRGIISGTNSICTANPTSLTLSDYTGTIVWQKATHVNGVTGTFATIVPSATITVTGTNGSVLNTGNLTASTAYRAVVTSGSCVDTTPAYVVTVSPAAKATAVTGHAGATTLLTAICPSVTKTLTIGTGYASSIQWQYYNAGTSATPITNTSVVLWNDIQDATLAVYSTSSSLVGNIWFRVKLTSGPCTTLAYSIPVNVWFKPCTTPIANNNPTPVSKTIVAPFEVKAYPNPYASTFQLNFTTSSESQVEIRVYDMIGKLIEVRQFSTTEMNNQEVGNNYPSGIYNVIVTQGENMKTLRVIKR
ncbi:Secretion system C-terminal sorting domain [Flavobacteriaceae bacterium]